jgi:sulfite reductase alpha subunit-like flavoprotein
VQAHVLLAVVEWTTPFKRKRSGLCSSWLAGLQPSPAPRVPVWTERGSLRLPASPAVPLLLVGPGTGGST